MMNSEQQYIELYKQTRDMICGHSAEVMNAVRDRAFADFQRLGFPSYKERKEKNSSAAYVERYKYTDIPALFAPDYGLNLNRLPIPVDPYNAFRCDVPNLSTSLYFVVNDTFYNDERKEARGEFRAPLAHQSEVRTLFAHQSEKGHHWTGAALPEGVFVGSLREFATAKPDLVASHYARIARTEKDGVTALNTMLAQDGLMVYVPKGVRLGRALQVINILRSDVDLMVNRRVLIILEEGAEAQLLFCDHAADDRSFLTTQVIEAYVSDNASLELYCLEETHAKNVRVSNVYIDQQANSRVTHQVITLHNGVTRNRLDLTFSGEGAECWCNGCVIADKQQHVDNNTLIDHAVGHCTSHELYKYVLDEQATGAFAGRVLVRHDAQKTVSEERNQNLCTTHEARMYTQPMLEIYADDVKCSHGSTVGQLNDAALFYMRQRGISEREARLLLEFAFINEVIDQITLTPLRDRLRYLVEKRFRGELNKCEGCKLCK